MSISRTRGGVANSAPFSLFVPGHHGAPVAALLVIIVLGLPAGSVRAQDDPDVIPPGPSDCQITYGPVMGPNGHFYEVVMGCDWSWHEANFEASLRSLDGATGHLATITSAAEDKFVEEVRQAALSSVGIDPFDPASAPQLWIGGFQLHNQAEINQGWSWVNGEGPIPETNFDPGYAHWLEGEPNDALHTAQIEDNEENYLTIGIFGQFGWNDEGANLGGYVVEYEAIEIPEISIRIEPLRLAEPLNDENSSFRMRRITAVHTERKDGEEDDDPPRIFVYNSDGEEPLGPYRSGTVFAFDLSGQIGPLETDGLVIIPIDTLPTIIARDLLGNASFPIALDLLFERGVLPAEFCGPTIPKDVLSDTQLSRGPVVRRFRGTSALAIQSFMFGFTNGDHRIGAFELTPTGVPGDTCDYFVNAYLSDRDYGSFGLEADDPVHYLWSFCDVQGICDVVSTGNVRAQGRARLTLPREIRPDEVVALAGFSFRLRSGNNQVREISVLPDPDTSTVEVYFGDDDGDDFYDVSVDLVVGNSSHFAPGERRVLIASPGGTEHLNVFPLGEPLPDPEQPLLSGFKFRFKSSENLERIGVILHPHNSTRAGRGRFSFYEDGRDVRYSGEIRYVGLLPRP